MACSIKKERNTEIINDLIFFTCRRMRAVGQYVFIQIILHTKSDFYRFLVFICCFERMGRYLIPKHWIKPLQE